MYPNQFGYVSKCLVSTAKYKETLSTCPEAPLHLTRVHERILALPPFAVAPFRSIRIPVLLFLGVFVSLVSVYFSSVYKGSQGETIHWCF